MKLLSSILMAISLAACATTNTLPANYFYEGSYINIHSPNQEGWLELKKTQSEIVFGKKGEKHNASYIARVVFFPMKNTSSDKDFLNLIKEYVSKVSDAGRFTIDTYSLALSNSRNYPCALGKSLLRDKNATTSTGSKEALLMQVKSLYCKDPKRKGAGFMIGYSYRGETENPHFDTEADSFISGVEFPEQK